MFTKRINGIDLCFDNTDKVFSPSDVDRGTLAMLRKADFRPDDFVLDLGCGYGVVGLLAAKLIDSSHVIMVDTSNDAILGSVSNAVLNGFQVDNMPDIRLSDGFENIPETNFTLILSNPPYHTDFSVAKKFIECSYKALVTNGRMIMVTKRLDWYKNKLSSVFGGVKVFEDDGYYVFIAEKRAQKNTEGSDRAMRVKKPIKEKKEMSKKLARKYASNKNNKIKLK